MTIKPNILFLCAGRPDYPSNVISMRVLQENFPTKVLISRCKSYYTRTVSVALRLPFYIHGVDVFYVGWMGQQLVPLIRLFTRKPIIFDMAPSLFDSFLDRGYAKRGSIKARILLWIDRYAYQQSRAVIIGDEGTREHFSKVFSISREKFRMFPVCADNKLFFPRSAQDRDSRHKDEFIVEFVSEMAPQHGISHVLRAAKLLEGSGITFRIAGAGQCLQEAIRVFEEEHPLNVTFLPYRIPLEQMLQWRSEAHVCLGFFGDTPKARRSLSNKLYEALAMGKAFLTAGPPEAFGVARHFTDEVELFWAPIANPRGLADKILWLHANKEICARVAAEGRKAYERMCSEEGIEKRIVNLVNEVAHR